VCRDDPFYTTPRAERLEKARALLKEAGKEGAEIGVIGSSTLSIYPLIAQVIQASLNEASFKAEVEKIPAADWYSRVFVAETDFDLAVSWYAGYSDPAMVLYWWTPEGAAGWADGYTEFDDDLTAAIETVRTSPKGPDRLAAMDKACRLINENASVLALVSKPDYLAYREDLVTVRIGAKEANFNMLKYAEEFSRKE
jgi:peptide/nickel transport system substrate-binding protein